MAYLADPSLTQIGIFSAGLVGKAYKKKGIKMDRVYASPSLRCIQTAEGFLNGYGQFILTYSILFYLFPLKPDRNILDSTTRRRRTQQHIRESKQTRGSAKDHPLSYEGAVYLDWKNTIVQGDL